jgi:hypothetical protein
MVDSNTEWIDVTVVAATDKAVLLTNGKDEAWIPRSQIVDEEEDLRKGVETRVEIPVWLLEKSGLV